MRGCRLSPEKICKKLLTMISGYGKISFVDSETLEQKRNAVVAELAYALD